MGKMMPPNIRIDWVPAAGLTTPGEPKATELNLGTNLTDAIETGYRLGATASDTDDSKTIGDEGNTETPTIGNYEAMLTIFKDDIGTGTNAVPQNASVFTTVFNLFKAGRVEGWLVKRLGYKKTVAYAAGQEVSVFRVVNDYVRETDGDKGAPNRVEIEFGALGEFYLNRLTVA